MVRHYIVPHEKNNFRAWVLSHPFLLFYVLALFIFQSGTFILRGMYPNILGYATNISTEKVLELANAERARMNLPPLTLSTELSSAAVNKANDMFSKNYWAHISPAGTTPWTFILGAGYNYTYAGENLAKNFDTSDEVVVAWMNSPTHRANILKPEYKEIGLAVVNGKLLGEDTTLVVQEFGARNSIPRPAIAFAEPTEIPLPTIIPEPQFVAAIVTVPPTVIPVEPTMIANVPVIANVQPAEVGGAYSPGYLTQLVSGAYNKTMALLLAQVLMVILFIDAIYMWRHRTVRVNGHSLAHIIFFATLLGALGATGVGAIL